MGTIKREPAIRAFSLMMVLTMLISILFVYCVLLATT